MPTTEELLSIGGELDLDWQDISFLNETMKTTFSGDAEDGEIALRGVVNSYLFSQ